MTRSHFLHGRRLHADGILRFWLIDGIPMRLLSTLAFGAFVLPVAAQAAEGQV